MKPSSQSNSTLKFTQLRYQGGEFIRTIIMKIFIGKTEGSHVTAVGKWLKSRCQIRTDNITDPSLDFAKNLEIYTWSTRPDMAAIVNARTNVKFINVQDGFWWEKLSGMTQWTNLLSSRCSIWCNIITPLHVSRKCEAKKVHQFILHILHVFSSYLMLCLCVCLHT